MSVNNNFRFQKQKDMEDLFIGKLSDVPDNVSYLSQSPSEQVRQTDIGMLWNSTLQHLRITSYQEQSYYEDYFMTTSYSNKIQEMQLNQAIKLSKLCEGAGSKTLVEIGCGDGSFLLHASNYFDHVIGIEPSKKFAESALSKGLIIKNLYVTEDADLDLNQVSAFVSRQVFEHLTDPLDCLLGIRKILKPGAVGLIEVPNGYNAFRKGNFFEFFPDHVHYYSVNSLVALATAAGFNVISCGETFGGDYLEIWVRFDNDQQQWLGKMNKMALDIQENINAWVSRYPNKSRAIFGCGAKTLSIIAKDSLFYSQNFDFVIDSDPNKHDRFVPNTSLRVVSPLSNDLVGLDSILILALSYKEEIVNLLRARLGTSVNLLTLNIDGSILEV